MIALKPIRTSPIAAAFAATALTAAAGHAIAADNDITPQITVSATGTADIAPDMAVIGLTVLREAETAREALDANTEAMAEILAAMRAEGIAERDLQTSNFNIQPRYVYPEPKDGIRPAPRIVGYQVSNSLTVRVRDLDRLGAILDQSVTLGVNQGGGISFTNDDPSAAITEARTKAMKAAISKAGTLTEAAGIGLGRILSISEQSSEPRPMPVARAAMMEMAADAAPVPVAAGENTYRVSVNVTFELAQ
ncbi:SIMPL domain-containing protein [Oceaniradius stylonematis]